MNDTATTAPSKGQRIAGAAAAIIFCNLVGIGGAYFTSPNTPWYRALQKPSFQPPGWIFGPMWTLLYTLMGIAAYRMFEKRDMEGARSALILFGVQLFLNGIWSPIFFGAGMLKLALVVIGLLLVVLAATIRAFLKVDPLGGKLLFPYIAWISFATLLNAAIVYLNP